MKKLLKNSFFRILIVITGNASLLIFLFTYIIPNTLTSGVTTAITVLLFAVFMIVFTITMLCELCFDEASKHLVAAADLNKAYEWIQRMKKLDVFYWYQEQYHVFMSVFFQDTCDYEGLKLLCENRKFQKNTRTKLVYNYCQFQLAMYNSLDNDVIHYFDLIEETYKQSNQHKREALIYSLGIIKAEKDLYFGHYKLALESLNKVSLDMLNLREQAHFYYLKYCILYQLDKKKNAKKFLNLAKERYPQGQFIIERKIGYEN